MRVLKGSIPRKPRRLSQNGSQRILKPELWRALVGPKKPKLQTARKHPRRRIVSNILIVAGSVLCAYVGGSYARMYIHQRKLLREWDKPSAESKNLTKLSIPKIALEDIVLEGASQHALLLGPAHLSASAIPGTMGNVVIAGHRDTFFRHIHRLRSGDDIYLLRSQKQFHYVVQSRRVVDSTDLSVLKDTNEGELTLITCYPTHAIGPAPRRLIIVAKLVSGTRPRGIPIAQTQTASASQQ
jgi:sortase A